MTRNLAAFQLSEQRSRLRDSMAVLIYARCRRFRCRDSVLFVGVLVVREGVEIREDSVF